MTDFDLGPVRGLRPDERDDAPVVTTADFARATWDEARHASNLDAHLFNYSTAFDGIADRVKAATGEALDNPFRSAGPAQSVEMLGTFSREAVEGSTLYAQWRQRVQELRAKHGDKLDWDDLLEEPGRVAWESMKKAREEADALSERIGMVAPKDVPLVGGIPMLNAIGALGANLVRHPQYTATQLAAGFAGQMTSPADAAVNLLSFGAGGAAKSIIKNATRNALANAAGQALLSAPKQLSYQSAGLPYGAQVWADEVGAAAGAGFVLDAGIRTPARAAIRRFGMDTPAGTTLSRNTERGGILFDAIEDATPAPRPRLEIDPETMRKAEAGDIAASREILEKTGAMEDPAVKYAVDHMEAGGRLTEDVLNLLEKELGVARPDGMKALAAAMQGRYLDSIPEPTREAPEPLMHEQGAVVLDRVEAVSGAMERLPAQVRQAVQDGLDAGIPRIVRAVQQILDDTPDRVPERIIEAVVPLLDERTVAEARLHSGRSGPIELAQTIRRFPDLIDSNADLDAQHIAMARTIAGMDDVAYADVARGTVPAEVAVLVADRVPRAAQARVLSDLQRAEPKSVAEAADLIEAIAPPRRVPGTEGQLAPGARIDDPAGPAAKARTEALRQEAGQAYADAMEPIQRRDAIEDELKKLRGQLIKGRREKASGEAKGGEGEATGPGAIRKQIEALEREHALLQAKIMPGPEGYELARLAMRAIDVRREADITAAVNDALRLGDLITPEGTRIDVRPDETMVSRAANGTVAQLDASSDMATGHIQLAVSAMDPAAKIGHEAVHTLVTRGHLSPTEVEALAALAREAGTFTREGDYRQAYEGRDGLERIISEEAAASYIEARIKGDVKGPENTVVERIRQLIERIRSALARQGFQSREDVVQAIMSGEAARREARVEWRRDAVIQGKTEMKATAERGTTLPGGTKIKGVPLFATRRLDPQREAIRFDEEAWSLSNLREGLGKKLDIPHGIPRLGVTEWRDEGQWGIWGDKVVAIGDMTVAHAQLTKYADGSIQIQKIQTLQAAQKRGIATALVHDLMAEHPGARITTTMQTDQGRALFNRFHREPDRSYRPKDDALFAIRAYHGSPHDFDRFSMDSIGTGEGAQAFGHGLYFAENEAVAKQYRRALAGAYEPGTIGGWDLSSASQAAKVFMASAGRHIDNAISDAVRRNDPRAEAELRAIKARGQSGEPGGLYEVRIDAEPDDFLDWDRPLGEQSAKIKKVVRQYHRQLVAEVRGMTDGDSSDYWADLTGSDLMEILQRKAEGVRVYEEDPLGARRAPDAKAVSDSLREAGVAGVRYLDAGSRNAAEGTHNFVVFDDSLIEITHKDGEPVAPPDARGGDITAAASPDGKLFALADEERRIPSLINRLNAVGGETAMAPAPRDLGFTEAKAPDRTAARASVDAIAETFSPEARRFLDSHPPRTLVAMIDMLGEDGRAWERTAIAELKPRMDDVRAFVAASRELETSLSAGDASDRAARLAKAAAEPRPIDRASYVYHGTTESFDQYSGEIARSRSAAAQDAGIDVIWVTPQKTFAERFGEPRRLTLEPGYYFDPLDDKDLARLAPYINAQPDANRLWATLDGIEGGQTWGVLENAETLKELQRLGYDGVRMQEQWVDASDRTKTAPTIAVFTRGKVFDRDRANAMFALRDPEPPIQSDMAFVDRMNRMGELIAVCKG